MASAATAMTGVASNSSAAAPTTSKARLATRRQLTAATGSTQMTG